MVFEHVRQCSVPFMGWVLRRANSRSGTLRDFIDNLPHQKINRQLAAQVTMREEIVNRKPREFAVDMHDLQPIRQTGHDPVLSGTFDHI